jgi:DegT/DnrJ/EryC1/StrS aminotransferase family
MTKAKKLIPVRPTFSIRELSTSRSRFIDGISSAPLRILTENCRTALFHALRTMPDSDHRNEVLMPAYNCGVEIETIISAGFTPSFFPVGPFCRVDPADIRRSINRHTAAVMLTHFNGFPQPAKEVKTRSLGVAAFHGFSRGRDFCILVIFSPLLSIRKVS